MAAAIAKAALEEHMPMLRECVHAQRYGWEVDMDWEPGHEYTISRAGIRMLRIKAHARGRRRRRRRRRRSFDTDGYLLELVLS